ncbi:MAG TPA: TraB/GumN family protein [Sphingomonadaceae bacterium]
MAARFVRLVTLFVALAAFQLTGARVAEAKDRPAHHKLAAPGPALWKVADKDTTIYLFGTVHALPKGTEWYKPHVKAAFESSDELVTEVSKQDLDSVGGLMSEVIYLPKGQNLRDLLPAPDREAFGMALVSLGIPVETFDRYKPWAAAFFLSLLPVQQAGFESDQGVDVKLTQMAGANVKHTALETAAFQIGLFNDMPQDKQIAYLRDVVRSIPEIAPQIEEIAAAWSAGDVDELSKVYLADDTDPLLHQSVITERNKAWAAWIRQRLKRPGTVFVAVGAGHLAGDDSVQAQLRKHGIKSVRVR